MTTESTSPASTIVADPNMGACPECGTQMTYGVLEAVEFLFHGGNISGDSFAEQIANGILGRAATDRRRVEMNVKYSSLMSQKPITDREIVESATSLPFYPEDLYAAVQHCAGLNHPDGSECDRNEAAKWCHVRNEVLAQGTSQEWARSLCNLEANHTEPHSFETGGSL